MYYVAIETTSDTLYNICDVQGNNYRNHHLSCLYCTIIILRLGVAPYCAHIAGKQCDLC